MTTTADPTKEGHAERQAWMRVLALGGRGLLAHDQQLRRCEHRYLRPPETGMVMLRGRAGGSGAAFNVGEMTVTRCVVQLADGRNGYSYVAGRDKRHARLAALADAHLQGADRQFWLDELIAPLAREQEDRRAATAREAAATRVDFVTMVRGEG